MATILTSNRKLLLVEEVINIHYSRVVPDLYFLDRYSVLVRERNKEVDEIAEILLDFRFLLSLFNFVARESRVIQVQI